MPRIRKKTSNRQSTNDRKKIQRKVRESKKKAKKSAKGNVQWKSKTPKDPGIPNNFPFKDQILAEVSETRRLEAEEKAQRKAQKKALRSGDQASGQPENGTEDVEMEVDLLTGLQVGNDAIGGVGAKQLVHAKTISRPTAKPTIEDSDEEEVPILINRDLPDLKTVIQESDVVIEVLDARDPPSFRSKHLEELVAAKEGAKLILVLNKIDLCPREAIAAWAAHLGGEYQTFPFRSSSAFLPTAPIDQNSKGKGKAKAPVDDAWGVDALSEALGNLAQAKGDDESLTVSVVGTVNAGKSALVNSLLKKAALAVYALDAASAAQSTTLLPQEVTFSMNGKDIRLIDTPGFSWKTEDKTEDRNAHRIRDVLLRSRGRVDKLKDPLPAVSEIIGRSNPEDLMLLYKTPAFAKGDTVTFLSGVARSNHLVKKHGDLDVVGASRIILRDWSIGTLARFTIPGKTEAQAATSEISPSIQSVIDRLQPRKELRKTVGIVKLTPGTADQRHLDFESPWAPLDSESTSTDSEAEELAILEGSEDEDEEFGLEDDIVDEDEPMEPIPLPSKNKRKREADMSMPGSKSKKVAFDIPSKSKAVPTRKAQTPKDGAAQAKAAKTVTAKAPPKSKPALPKAPKTGAIDDEAYDFGKFF